MYEVEHERVPTAVVRACGGVPDRPAQPGPGRDPLAHDLAGGEHPEFRPDRGACPTSPVRDAPEARANQGLFIKQQIINHKPHWWKYPAAERVLTVEKRPLIWIDDDIELKLFPEHRQALGAMGLACLVSPDGQTGLLSKHMPARSRSSCWWWRRPRVRFQVRKRHGQWRVWTFTEGVRHWMFSVAFPHLLAGDVSRDRPVPVRAGQERTPYLRPLIVALIQDCCADPGRDRRLGYGRRTEAWRAAGDGPTEAPSRLPGLLGAPEQVPGQAQTREPKPKRLCELVPGAPSLHAGLGGCWSHYYRLRTYEDPLGQAAAEG